MLAIQIDAVNKKIIPIQVETIEDMQKVVGGFIETACYLDTGDACMVDDDGLSKYDHFFAFTDGSSTHPFAGNGLIIGAENVKGQTMDCIYDVHQIEQRVIFMTRAEVISWLNDNRAYDRTGGFARIN